MTNLLFRCALMDDIETVGQEPRETLLRIYGPAHSDTETQLKIFKQLADENLGPKLYATFQGGRLEEYLPSSSLSWNEMTDSRIYSVIATKIAAIQKLNVQSLNYEHISSDTSNNNFRNKWLLDKYNQLYDFNLKKDIYPSIFDSVTLESTKRIAEELVDVNFRPEIDFLENIFKLYDNQPLVFSHNDLHQNNIILLNNTEASLQDRVVLIDFEYCSYNYKTFDLANFLSEWCFDYNGNNEYPFFLWSKDRFPSEEKQKEVLKYYLEANLDRTLGDQHQNGIGPKLEQLFDEMQPFLMASNLLWTLWAIKSAYTSKINFGYWVSKDFTCTLSQ